MVYSEILHPVTTHTHTETYKQRWVIPDATEIKCQLNPLASCKQFSSSRSRGYSVWLRSLKVGWACPPVWSWLLCHMADNWGWTSWKGTHHSHTAWICILTFFFFPIKLWRHSYWILLADPWNEATLWQVCKALHFYIMNNKVIQQILTHQEKLFHFEVLVGLLEGWDQKGRHVVFQATNTTKLFCSLDKFILRNNILGI